MVKLKSRFVLGCLILLTKNNNNQDTATPGNVVEAFVNYNIPTTTNKNKNANANNKKMKGTIYEDGTIVRSVSGLTAEDEIFGFRTYGRRRGSR